MHSQGNMYRNDITKIISAWDVIDILRILWSLNLNEVECSIIKKGFDKSFKFQLFCLVFMYQQFINSTITCISNSFSPLGGHIPTIPSYRHGNLPSNAATQSYPENCTATLTVPNMKRTSRTNYICESHALKKKKVKTVRVGGTDTELFHTLRMDTTGRGVIRSALLFRL